MDINWDDLLGTPQVDAKEPPVSEVIPEITIPPPKKKVQGEPYKIQDDLFLKMEDKIDIVRYQIDSIPFSTNKTICVLFGNSVFLTMEGMLLMFDKDIESIAISIATELANHTPAKFRTVRGDKALRQYLSPRILHIKKKKPKTLDHTALGQKTKRIFYVQIHYDNGSHDSISLTSEEKFNKLLSLLNEANKQY